MNSSAFWRRTPPALFPATLGMFGLSLGWRAATELGAPHLIADLIFAATTAFFVFAFGAYIVKLSRRPAVVFEDMNPVPGRAAVSAGSMCLLLLAAGLHGAGGSPEIARPIWIAGFALHVAYMICVTIVFARTPKPERIVTPVLFLPYVGYIVSPIGGAPLGFETLSNIAFLWSLAAGAVITALAAPRFFIAPTPPSARAAAAIMLAPTSLAAVSGALLGYGLIAQGFAYFSIAVAAALLLKARWLTAGGFTPLWGAFTFPAAAFASAMIFLAGAEGGGFTLLAWAALAGATAIIPPIWVMTILAWSRGRLAPPTGAGTV